MVMSITFALQQKHQDEQYRLCTAIKLLMQSPGYIEVFVKKKTNTQTGSSPREWENVIDSFFFATYYVFYSPHGSRKSQGDV